MVLVSITSWYSTYKLNINGTQFHVSMLVYQEGPMSLLVYIIILLVYSRMSDYTCSYPDRIYTYTSRDGYINKEILRAVSSKFIQY